MNKITVSAPGKLMLFGEHAVVYNRPCIVTAVDQRMKATVSLLNTPVFELHAPDVEIKVYKKPIKDLGKGEIPKGAKFVEIAAANFLKKYTINTSHSGVASDATIESNFGGLKITTSSEFSSQFGLGSSSAACVCTIFALSKLFNIKLTQKQIFDLAYKTVLDIQGKGSGFDVAAAIWGSTIYFVTGGKTIKPILYPSNASEKSKNNSRPERKSKGLNNNSLPLIVAYSGIKADTVSIINRVAEKHKKYPQIIENIYDQIEILVEKAKTAIELCDWQTLGELMDFNQGYLEALGVGSKELVNLIYAARKAGAYGAKLSGAGVGDCMIAISLQHKIETVKLAIQKAGGQIIDVKSNAEGIRVEK